MVKLERNYTPVELNPAFVAAGVAKFKADGESVWNLKWLKEALLSLSHDKCAYCECRLTVESNYMEVEHFEDKATYPDKVLEWSNLLPACKHCNSHKQGHDVNKEPIVNPVDQDPRSELYMRLYRIEGKTPMGVTTVETLNLNDSSRVVQVRFELGEALQTSLRSALDRMNAHKSGPTTYLRNRLTAQVRHILELCQPTATYSALCSTLLTTSSEYRTLKTYLSSAGLWTAELDELHQMCSSIALEHR